MPPKRMTANPVKPARYRPGKPTADVNSSEDEEEDEDELASPPPAVAPEATRIATDLKKVDLNARRRQAAAQEAARLEAEKAARAEEEGFVTEESEEEVESGESEESESSEESSSEEEVPKVLLRPTFIRKDKRKDVIPVDIKLEADKEAEEELRRKEQADELVQEQLEKNAAARAAGKKNWDDDELADGDMVDDTDGLDPEAERAAWKLRELKRVKREREAIETAEKEREEVERRRNLNQEDRDAEDREFIERQKEEQDGKGRMGYLQKYYHKGAFFQDDAKAEGLDRRDIMGSRYQDDVANRETLPEYMQIRDMTKLGRKGRTKYKDLKSEDTGRWGGFEGKGQVGERGMDERFLPDRSDGRGASGANATIVKERRKAPEGAPEGPRAWNERESRERADTYIPGRDGRDGRWNGEGRRRSYSRSRSPLPRRDRPRDDRDRRKRSPSPYIDRHNSDKRRRVDAT